MLFSEDCENPDPREPQTTLHGREAIAERTAELAGDWQRAHRGTMPDIELIDETSATGVWALHCANSRLIDGGAAHHHIFGYYTETYRKDADGQWRIKRIQYDNDLMIATSGPVRPYRQDEADN